MCKVRHDLDAEPQRQNALECAGWLKAKEKEDKAAKLKEKEDEASDIEAYYEEEVPKA